MASDTLVEALRSRGLRMTAQRDLVLRAVRRLGHATPEQVHSAVTETAGGVNITTVYRTLELLEDLGLVTHTHLGHGAPTFHAAGPAQHVHLVCRRCEEIQEVPAALLAPVSERLREEHGFTVDVAHVALSGVCTRCREAADLAPLDGPPPPADEPSGRSRAGLP